MDTAEVDTLELKYIDAIEAMIKQWMSENGIVQLCVWPKNYSVSSFAKSVDEIVVVLTNERHSELMAVLGEIKFLCQFYMTDKFVFFVKPSK